MDDLISRQQAINALRGYLVEKRCPDDGTLTCRLIENEVINKLPSVQPERKTGRWIPDDSELGIKCNNCGKSFSDYVNAGTGYMFLEEIPNFCPNCGHDLRGEQDQKEEKQKEKA